ncbi:hypothetical protein [Erythrobacter sp. R86502]|uniref:hypothetical protein n=1 Tax=Erythrobacter sp. R86502 TaxID=3093846 RepID=UPI0036D31518
MTSSSSVDGRSDIGATPVAFTDQHSPEIVEVNDDNSAGSFDEAVAEVGDGSMLGYRLTQQAILSDFGLHALKQCSFDALLDDAAVAAAEGMRTGLAKILEYRKDECDLLIRAGVG